MKSRLRFTSEVICTLATSDRVLIEIHSESDDQVAGHIVLLKDQRMWPLLSSPFPPKNLPETIRVLVTAFYKHFGHFALVH